MNDDDDDEIVYFTVRWKTRELVLSTAPKHEITPTKTVKIVFYRVVHNIRYTERIDVDQQCERQSDGRTDGRTDGQAFSGAHTIKRIIYNNFGNKNKRKWSITSQHLIELADFIVERWDLSTSAGRVGRLKIVRFLCLTADVIEQHRLANEIARFVRYFIGISSTCFSLFPPYPHALPRARTKFGESHFVSPDRVRNSLPAWKRLTVQRLSFEIALSLRAFTSSLL